MRLDWNKLTKLQPLIGFRTRAIVKGIPEVGRKNRSSNLDLKFEAACREELIGELHERLSDECWAMEGGSDYDRYGNYTPWKQKHKKQAALHLEDPALKQPEVTRLHMGDDADYYGDEGDKEFVICERECCMNPLLHTMDAVVGLPALLLNPERYTGNWWETSLEEFYNGETLRWYGTDNFFLRHSSLVSMIMGLFRQAYLLHRVGLNRDLEKLAPREEVVQALRDSDPDRGFYLAQKIRDLIAPPRAAGHYPLGNGWELFANLHRAIYKHGYDEVFGGTIEDAWAHQERCGSRGAVDYFVKGAKKNEAAKRVARLAR